MSQHPPHETTCLTPLHIVEVIGRDGSMAFTVLASWPRLRVVESPESSAGRRSTCLGGRTTVSALEPAAHPSCEPRAAP
jgi:hypothetical protein